jgi:hypothetical protein
VADDDDDVVDRELLGRRASNRLAIALRFSSLDDSNGSDVDVATPDVFVCEPAVRISMPISISSPSVVVVVVVSVVVVVVELDMLRDEVWMVWRTDKQRCNSLAHRFVVVCVYNALFV